MALNLPPTAYHRWSARMVDSIIRAYPLENAEWHYEHGLMVQAIHIAAQALENKEYQQFTCAWLDRFITPDGNIRTYCLEDYNLDQINPGKLLFSLFLETKQPRFRKALELLYQQLRQQPRTPSGGFWHKKIYPDQMWLDGIYMAGPFYAQYAQVFDQPQGFDDLAAQIILIEAHTREAKSGLLVHGWDESRRQAWADPGDGRSPHVWGRAVGWFMMALVDILDFFPAAHPEYPNLLKILQGVSAALVPFQDRNSGLWYQIIDQPARAGNYLESSASAMFTYAFAKAVRNHYLPLEYYLSAQRAFRGLLEKHIKIDQNGFLTLGATCGGVGLGGEPYRDGSFEYYVQAPIIANDFKGAGPFVLAALEMEAIPAVLPSE